MIFEVFRQRGNLKESGHQYDGREVSFHRDQERLRRYRNLIVALLAAKKLPQARYDSDG